MSFPRGVCRFCKLTAEQLERRELAFLDRAATRCNAIPCVKAFDEAEAREFREDARRREMQKAMRDRVGRRIRMGKRRKAMA